jgi:hypothetical protein
LLEIRLYLCWKSGFIFAGNPALSLLEIRLYLCREGESISCPRCDKKFTWKRNTRLTDPEVDGLKVTVIDRKIQGERRELYRSIEKHEEECSGAGDKYVFLRDAIRNRHPS